MATLSVRPVRLSEVRRQFSKSLKESHLFRRLYHKGRSAANGYLVLYCRRNGTQENRIGLTVSRKLGHAVVRNRVRRRLREIYRLHEGELNPGYDIVVVARVKAVYAQYGQRETSFLSFAGKLGLRTKAGGWSSSFGG